MLKKTIWVLNIFAATGLLLSFLAGWISPETVWWLALFGLAFEILYAVNLIFMTYWILVRNKKFILSLVLILSGLGKIAGVVQFNFPSESETVLRDKGYLKVMSFNVRLFDLYNWFHNNETRHRIFDFLKKESPDIICFQEFFSSDRKEQAFNNEDSLMHYINASFAQVEYTITLHTTEHWGIATFSKFPIIRKSAVHFETKGGNIFISSDLKIGNDTIRVFNTHLESVRFGMSDYKFIENLSNDDVDQDDLKGSIGILKHLKLAFVKRGKQVDQLHDSIAESPYPVILCGDFNDTPGSYSYSVLSDNLKDAFRVSGNGSAKTYAGPFPSFRIDYIFHDKKIESSAYQTIHEKLSDHYPVSCMVKIK